MGLLGLQPAFERKLKKHEQLLLSQAINSAGPLSDFSADATPVLIQQWVIHCSYKDTQPFTDRRFRAERLPMFLPACESSRATSLRGHVTGRVSAARPPCSHDVSFLFACFCSGQSTSLDVAGRAYFVCASSREQSCLVI